MEGAKFADAQQAATIFVDRFDLARHQIGIVTFDAQSTLEHQLSQDSNALKATIAGLETGHGTNITKGINQAQAELGSARHTPNALAVMVILSDGEGDEPRADTIAAAKAAKDQGTRIITIMIGKSNAAKALMSEIASSPNDFHMMSSTKELAAIYNQLAVELSGCISGAISPSPTASATPEPSPAPTETLTPVPATPEPSPAPTETPAIVVTPGATAMPTPVPATPVASPAPTEAAQTLATPPVGETPVPSTPTAPPSMSASTIPCVADTYINRDEPDTPHGNEPVVKVSASVPERWALIRCQAPAQPLQHVALRVYVAENSQDVVISKAESAWSEQTTWNSRPQIGAQVAFYANTTKGTWLDIDVTQAMQADGTISLVIQSHSTRDIEIATRERSGYGPQLVIR
jgi:uncharacterized protein YegL